MLDLMTDNLYDFLFNITAFLCFLYIFYIIIATLVYFIFGDFMHGNKAVRMITGQNMFRDRRSTIGIILKVFVSIAVVALIVTGSHYVILGKIIQFISEFTGWLF